MKQRDHTPRISRGLGSKKNLQDDSHSDNEIRQTRPENEAMVDLSIFLSLDNNVNDTARSPNTECG
jgi:hypothetical protein